jgi:hypothetical protein
VSDSKFAILVNTTDSFEDCWLPFFKLFKLFWPSYNGTIYLNTEKKSFVYQGLNIISVKSGLTDAPWAKCLEHAVNRIDEDCFIYMQEDYFLHSMVNFRTVENLYREFVKGTSDCLHLTDQCTIGPFGKSSVTSEIWRILNGADYRVSTQAAFWKTKSILSIIRPWESGWDFERFGTARSVALSVDITCVNQDVYKQNVNELMPYVFTGIIKGKWKPEVVPLFKNHEIDIDFNTRGFVGSQERYWFSKTKTMISMGYKYAKNVILEFLFAKGLSKWN